MKTSPSTRAFALSLGLCLASACSNSSTSATSGAVSSAARIHVDAAAPAGGSGKSWSSALNDLRVALDMARAGDEIWVARGTYLPAGPNGDRRATFALKRGVAVYGGFVGDETELAARDWNVNTTILSGDFNGDDAAQFAHMTENALHIVTVIDGDERTRLDGFTITNGRADGVGTIVDENVIGLGDTVESDDQGSAIQIFGGAPRFSNLVVQNNWTKDHGAVSDHGFATLFTDSMWCSNYSDHVGAGLYMHDTARTSVEHCTFIHNEAHDDGAGTFSRSTQGARFVDCEWTGNSALRGAGMFHAAGSSVSVEGCAFHSNRAELGGGGSFGESATTTITNCLFEGGSAGLLVVGGGGGSGGSGGGGVWFTGGEPIVANCLFRNNQASFGGGLYFIEDSFGHVIDCDFVENTAHEAGGLYDLASSITVHGCTFVHNEALGGAFPVGGGVSTYFSDAYLEDCTFIGNRAELGGGGQYFEGEDPIVVRCHYAENEAFGSIEGFGGGVLAGYHTRLQIANCTFAANHARLGGGFYAMFAAEPRVVNCTFAANKAGHGGGIFSNLGNLAVYRNCIVFGSIPDDLAGSGPSDFQFGCASNAGAGNATSDPLLVRMPSVGADGLWGTDDDDFGDLRLTSGSPCIDAGTNRALPAGIATDGDGHARFVDDPNVIDTGVGQGAIVDVGAFEMP